MTNVWTLVNQALTSVDAIDFYAISARSWERERERESISVFASTCVCACVCMRLLFPVCAYVSVRMSLRLTYAQKTQKTSNMVSVRFLAQRNFVSWVYFKSHYFLEQVLFHFSITPRNTDWSVYLRDTGASLTLITMIISSTDIAPINERTRHAAAQHRQYCFSV